MSPASSSGATALSRLMSTGSRWDCSSEPACCSGAVLTSFEMTFEACCVQRSVLLFLAQNDSCRF